MHDELPDGDLTTLLERVTDDCIALVGLIAIGHKVVGFLVIAAVDLGLVNEAHHVDSVLSLKLQLIHLLGMDQNMMPLGMLVAFDDLLVRHLSKGICIPLHIFDGLA